MTREEGALAALKALPHAVAIFEPGDRLVLANAAFWTAAGAEASRFPPGTPLRDVLRLLAFRGLLGPGDPQQRVTEALALDRSLHQTRHVRSADGTRMWERSTAPLTNGGFAICAVDITALNRAESMARARIALLERVLTAQRGGIALFDAEQRLMLHNAAYRRHSGTTLETLAGRPTLREIMQSLERAGEFLSADDHDHLRDAIAADRSQPRDAQRERADGTVVRFISTPQPDGGFLIESDDVTKLRRAEDEARRRAAILDGVLEALPHGICVWGPDRSVVLFNDAYARLMEGAPLAVGDTLEDVIRRRAAAGEFGPGEAEEIYAREMARDLSRPQARRRQRANGTALDIRTAPLPDGGHVSVVTDITETWRAEAEARHRAALLETALASMRHGFVLYGPDRRVVMNNALAAELAGHAPDDIRPGRSLDELVSMLHASGALGEEPEASALLRHSLAMDRSKPHRWVRRSPSGRVLEVFSDPTPDGGFVITHVDTTALAEAEAAAQQRAGILRVMLENMRHGICLFDAEGRVVAANALAADMTGIAPEELRPGRHILDLREAQIGSGEYGTPEDAKVALDTRWGEPLRAPDRYIRRRRSGRIIEVTTDRTPDGGYVRTYTDVTEDRRIRDELEQARAAAEAASEAKSRFLATMSHELRTPLSAVIGYAEAMLAEGADGAVADYAGAVRQAGRQLLRVIEDVLDVARAGPGEAEEQAAPVDLMATATAALRMLEPAAREAGLRIGIDAAPHLPNALCAERRLRRVLLALLDNAIKFTPEGGTVRVAIAPDGSGGVSLSVADSGIGIAPEDIPRAFEPFTQIDTSHARRFGGAGLGLHLARLLAEAMGGRLSLHSRPGFGTTATLHLPRESLIAPAALAQETP